MAEELLKELRSDFALRESEERFRTAFTNAAIGMGLATSEGRILHVNPALCAITGYDEAELLATDFQSITHPADLPEHLASIRRMLAGEIPGFVVQQRYLRKDGAVVWVQNSVTLARDAEGRPSSVVAFVQDVTAHRMAEDALRVADEQYRSLFENVPLGMFKTTPEGRFIAANGALARMYGYESPQAFVESVTDIGRQLYVDPLRRAEFARLLQERDTLNRFEIEVYRRDGSRMWTSVSAHGVADPSGMVRYYEGVVEEVTERKRGEDALRESEQRFRLAFDHAPIGMALVALDGRWLRVNRALSDLTGYAEHQLLRMTFQDITHPEDLDADLALSRRLVAGEIESYTMEKRYFHKLGHVVWILLHGSLVRSETGEPLYFVAQIKDISESKCAEAALGDSERRYRLLFETNPLPMWLFDAETLAFLAVNEAAVRHYGYSRDEFLAMTVNDIRPPEDLPRFLKAVRRGRSGFANSGVWRHRKKDAALIDVEVAVDSLLFEGRQARLVVVHDVTERRRADVALQARARQQAAVADLGQRALGGLSLDSLMAEAAAAVTRTLDVELSEILERLPERDLLLLRAGSGWKDGLVGRAVVSAGADSHAGLLQGEPAILEEPSTLLRDHGVVSGVSVAIGGPEQRFGVLGAHTTRRRAFTTDDVHFLRSIANVLAAALIRSREEDVRRQLLEGMISAQEDERKRISRELHDGPGQSLTALLVGLRRVQDLRSLAEARLAVARQRELVAQTIDELSRMARGLRPTVLDDLGIVAALRRYTTDRARLFGFDVSLEATALGRRRLPREVETALYRVVQEAFANAARHARPSLVSISLARRRDVVQLTVSDDGCGFEVDRALEAGRHLGLHDIRERAALVGGHAEIRSRPGHGTVVAVSVHLQERRSSRRPPAGRSGTRAGTRRPRP